MTREELIKIWASGPKGNPERRQIDFMLRRLSVAGDENAVATRGLMDDGTITEGVSLAETRLAQLKLFRERQEDEDKRLAVAAESGARDFAVSGKLNWVPMGPAGYERGQAGSLSGTSDGVAADMSGRVAGMAIAPGGQRVYLAAANGGVWLSNNGGRHWLSMMDGINYFPDAVRRKYKSDSLSCGAIALVAGGNQFEDKIYVGTGENGSLIDTYMGIGAMVSTDGGVNWITEPAMPSLIGNGFNDLVVHPIDTEKVIGATNIGVYLRLPSGGTYEWRQQGFNDRVVWSVAGAKDAANAPRFYASVRDGVFPVNNADGTISRFWTTQIYTSPDGAAWTLLNDNFPTSRGGRTSLAVHPNNANIVYALVANTGPQPTTPTAANPANGSLEGIYRLDYAGDKKWYKITGKTKTDSSLIAQVFGDDPASGGQGYYDICLTVAPDNPNRIYVGGSIKMAGGQWSGGIYRCDLTVTKTVAATTVQANVAYIGEAVHGDIHALAFVPNEPTQLWVGCDGGAFFTNRAKANGIIFEPRNAGLQIITHNYMGLSAKEEEYFFVCGQDSGTMRYFGDDIWLHSFTGDGGYCIVNWAKDNEVIATYTNNSGFKSTNGGTRPAKGVGYSVTDWSVPLTQSGGNDREQVLFYAPLVGVPYVNGLNVEKSEIIAFGTQRPWISTNFGDTWKPIPSLNGNLTNYNADMALLEVDNRSALPIKDEEKIQAMAFASSTILLTGSTEGKIHCFVDESPANKWAVKAKIKHYRLDNKSEGVHILNNSVTDFAVVSDAPLKFYVTLGGSGLATDAVWLCDATDLDNPVWVAKSGRKGADMTKALLDFQYNSIVINPALPTQLFVGSDVGVWKSDNNGDDWETFSFGLPETPIIDLKIFAPNDMTAPTVPVLLRAATHGRGVFECNLSEATTPDVKLYFRANALDRGRYKINLDKKDPRNPSVKISVIDTPDIKIDVPNTTTGRYAFLEKQTLSAGQFRLQLTDEADNIPIPVTGDATTRIYVQINSRGAIPANNVHVLLLMKQKDAGSFTDLPADYDVDLIAGNLINRDGWMTIGFKKVQGVKAGAAQVVRFDFSSSQFADKTTITNNEEFVLVALLHHIGDPFASKLVKIGSVADANNLILSDERKAMFKVVKVKKPATAPPSVSAPSHLPLMGFVTVPATATAAEAPIDAFLGMAFRLNDDLIQSALISRLAQPFSNRGVDAPTSASLDARSFYLADTIILDKEIELQEGVSLIWCARKKITLSKKIIAKGKGDILTGVGDFGGSGGGGNTVAFDCVLPNQQTVQTRTAVGGAINTVGQDANEQWASRVLLMLPSTKGGSMGGGNSVVLGVGGGVVVLCAPIIEFIGEGAIDASGGNGGGNNGGGGGGVIVLLAGEIIGHTPEKTNIEGGISASTGGKGGKGFLMIKRIFNAVV